MRNIIALCLLALVGAGCTSQAVEEMGAGEASAPWAELDALEAEPMMSIGYPGEMGDWGSAKSAAASDTFQTAVSNFEQSPLPEGYEGKETQKAAVVEALNALVEAGNSGSPDDVKAKYEAVVQAISQLRQ
jgi:hypothetical protein